MKTYKLKKPNANKLYFVVFMLFPIVLLGLTALFMQMYNRGIGIHPAWSFVLTPIILIAVGRYFVQRRNACTLQLKEDSLDIISPEEKLETIYLKDTLMMKFKGFPDIKDETILGNTLIFYDKNGKVVLHLVSNRQKDEFNRFMTDLESVWKLQKNRYKYIRSSIIDDYLNPQYIGTPAAEKFEGSKPDVKRDRKFMLYFFLSAFILIVLGIIVANIYHTYFD